MRVWDLGSRRAGEVLEITLSGTAANVRLVDASNLGRLKRGQQHRYTGGHYTRSPVRMPIPSNGQWHVVIDHGGNRGSTRAAVRVLPGNLPAGRTLKPSGNVRAGLEEIAGNVADLVEHSGDVIDVFISHAWEDKDAVARPLAAALRDRGLEVWFDEYALQIGDSLRRKIDDGLRRSRFGVVILSPTFFRKGWAQYELDGLVTLSVTGRQVLLPVWHDLTADQLREHSPSLADKVALSTGELGIDDIAAKISTVVTRSDPRSRSSAWSDDCYSSRREAGP